MPRFIIERNIARANTPTSIPAKFDGVVAKRRELQACNTRHVAQGNVHRVHDAESLKAISQHTEESGFLANRAAAIEAMNDPAGDAATQPLWPSLSGLPGLVVAAVRRWWQTRKASAVLADSDASVLRDLGIARSDIESVVRHGRR